VLRELLCFPSAAQTLLVQVRLFISQSNGRWLTFQKKKVHGTSSREHRSHLSTKCSSITARQSMWKSANEFVRRTTVPKHLNDVNVIIALTQLPRYLITGSRAAVLTQALIDLNSIPISRSTCVDPPV